MTKTALNVRTVLPVITAVCATAHAGQTGEPNAE